ncbi:MAG: COX15/CtaA family protein [Betaproteobacteria bacterium]|nr:COX15/CtaA family protein [Betaproteobacteria bacterium]
MASTTNPRAAAESARTQIAYWLLACCGLVFAMVVLGGVTRLTRSGLSIVEWQPLVGALPPLSDASWMELFDKYKHSPEYQKVNAGMSLEEFKGIFWLEYFHRLLGRLIGLAFFVPFAYFLARRMVGLRLGLKLGGIFVLGALQGLLGWYMVDSGLINDPRVSQYRLTAHLALAFAIFAAMLWTALDLLAPEPAVRDGPAVRGLRRWMYAVTALLVVMMLTGAFVAGIRAGLAYNTFPLMNGHVVPPEMFMLDPWYANFFNNMATVQFDHRLFAWVLAFAVPWVWFRAQSAGLSQRTMLLFHLLFATLALQVALGIGTLLLAVPVALGAAHQGGALVVFTVALLLNHELRHESAARAAAVQLRAA